MFYSTEILTNRKGGFGIVWYGETARPWKATPCNGRSKRAYMGSRSRRTRTRHRLAATLGARSHTRRITRREYASVDVPKTW